MIRSALMNVMTGAALKAGRGLKRDFGEVENLQVSVKGPGDFVSAADKRAEKVLFEELSKARPGYGFLMEESGAVEGSDKSHTFIIDPLDGTTNFLHGLPIFSISIGLVREGQVVAGLVYNPANDDMFVAEKGQGAYLNNRRLRVAARRDLGEALIGCGTPHIGKANGHARFKQEFSAVMANVANIRRLGSAALDLCYVAAGNYDGFWERDLQQWDIAAGIIMVKEAGGYITDADGGPDPLAKGTVCAGNDLIHRALLALVKQA
ncbi:Inositol-phosphate phosphatase [Methylocella silvestris BL2]|uniref:Inositol-1-monophosphatase n=1 Tax=Methylocella silvestris (strain DSM 15510 / CIP 108128 / LMG 27833 / NCIMB 13906 / BL2) TaxID=395965 RepID=B8EJA2_METSB|nr:inositol monophosphatase family protein [Methylocella silvestris]ACK52594.1 Inositol-phosphate phosphatase [Methylocella silvestris BL2]